MQDDQTEHFEKPFIFRRLSMDALADTLLGEIQDEVGNGNLFHKIQIIVPNRSIQRYLSLRFAQRYGIAAQLEFPSLMSVFQRFLLQMRDRPKIDGKTIGWRIYRILREPGADTAFPALTQWIKGDSKRLYDLSRQLGELYDKYMLYRPWWINAWEAGSTPQGLNDEPNADWQGELWRRITVEDWKGNHFAGVFDRIVCKNELNSASREERTKDGETVRIFGFSQLPPTVLQCLEKIHQFGTNVKLYHLVPSGEYYADCKKNKDELREFLDQYFREGQDPVRLLNRLNSVYFQHNPLLASFAMQSCVMLNRTVEWNDDIVLDDPAENMPDEGTILHRLQTRIRGDMKSSGSQPPKQEKGRGCRSVQIRNCYSAFREVEAAHNFILHCMDEDHDLPLKDIFIMTPTPADYAPLVDAVFNHSARVPQRKTADTSPGNRENGTRRLEVSIADQPQTERLSSYSTLMKILSLFKGDFAASEIFAILQDRSFQEHWGFTSEDCRYCLTRAMQAGIRWGWDAEEHRLSGGKAFPENSWQAGFDRMLLDYAMDADPMSPYQINDEDAVFPVPGFDGSRAELLGKFIALTTKLHETAQVMRNREQTGVPFLEWQTSLADLAACLFGRDSQLKALLLSVLNTWHQELAEAGAEDVPLTSGIVLAYLQDKHVKPEDNTMGFMRGKITFCGLRPMRSIPADVILLLGMNHKTFPGEDDDREFDIMQQYRTDKNSMAGRAPGDPIKRDESRQLFLDTIMAARKYLYISFVGRDIHDRKDKPPSVCVDELKNYLTQEFGINSFIELKEPIHAFSPELFENGTANQSFSTNMRIAAQQIAGQSSTASSGEKTLFEIRRGVHSDETVEAFCERVELDDLRWFFVNPAGKYVRDTLDARLSVRESSFPEDSESFENKLDFDVKDGLFRSCLESADRETLKDVSLRRLKADGSIPLMQNADDWGDWSDMLLLAQGMEACADGLTEQLIPAGEMNFEYSAADVGELAGLIYDTVPVGTFRTTLILPDMKVYRLQNPDEPCVRMEWSFTKEPSGSQLIRPILNHLRANLDRKTVTRIVCLDKTKYIISKADAMERADAETIMRRFLCLYHAGMRKPLPFFPKASYAYYAEPDERIKKAKAESRWNGYRDSKGEVEKFGDFFGFELPFGEAFKMLAEAFFGAVVFRPENSTGKVQRKRK
jgi:exodeoxyribonuclease V gamma subunit